jgi:HK97 family phage portal protein
MAWYDPLSLIFRSFLKTEAKPKQLDHGANWNSPHGERAPYDPSKALSSYGLHSWTHAAVSRQAQDLAALPLKLMKGKGADAQQIDDHPFLELMEFPSTTMDYYLFAEQVLIDLRLTGNAFVLLLGPDIPSSIVRLHPGLVEITSDESGITGYAYDTGAGQKVVYPVDRVIHMRNASYKSGPQSMYGTGIVEVLAQDIDADLNAQRLASQASKRGHPSILISPTDPADIWDANRRKAVLDQYQGLAKSGGAMAMSGQASITSLKLSPKDMEFKTSREMARQAVGAVAGTPTTILTLESANYATARQAAISYYQNLQKIGRRLELALTKIARLFDRSLYVKLDYSGVESLQSLRTEQLNRINLHILNGADIASAYAYEGLADFPLSPDAEPAPIDEELIEEMPADFDEDDETEEIDETIENFFMLYPPSEDLKKKAKGPSRKNTVK